MPSLLDLALEAEALGLGIGTTFVQQMPARSFTETNQASVEIGRAPRDMLPPLAVAASYREMARLGLCANAGTAVPSGEWQHQLTALAMSVAKLCPTMPATIGKLLLHGSLLGVHKEVLTFAAVLATGRSLSALPAEGVEEPPLLSHSDVATAAAVYAGWAAAGEDQAAWAATRGVDLGALADVYHNRRRFSEALLASFDIRPVQLEAAVPLDLRLQVSER